MSLTYYENRFRSLNPNSAKGHVRPHKMCMLLAVMDLVEQGEITENRIYFNDNLKQAFSSRFEQFKKSNDQNTPVLPYYHLRSSGFWHHKVKADQNVLYDSIEKSTSERKVRDSIEYVHVDDELFEYFRSSIARQCLSIALAENFDTDLRDQLLNPTHGWTWQECELVVNDYLLMLELELKGEKYNKAEHNRSLQKLLPNRTKGAIEKKHQNISAILLQMGLPVIDGYKPLFNYQRQILPDVVGATLANNTSIQLIITQQAFKPNINPPLSSNILASKVDAPDRESCSSQVIPTKKKGEYTPKKRDYVSILEKNIYVGLKGEQFVMDYEKAYLRSKGKESLADKIEHVSLDDDTEGFDIRSFDEQGRDRLIEVKTTLYDRYCKFFVSDNELKTSKRYNDKYYLYRLFTFERDPRFYVRQGDIEQNFQLAASTYIADVR